MEHLPVLSEFYELVRKDLAENFHPTMERLQQALASGSEDFRECLKSCIVKYDGGPSEATVIGIDASSKMIDAGEVASILACGVGVCSRQSIRPINVFKTAFGTASEELGRIKSALTICAEIECAVKALEQSEDAYVLWDGGFSALNLEINKAASVLDDDLARQYIEKDLDALFTGPNPAARAVFEGNAHRLVSVAKRGISRQYAKKLSLPAVVDLSDKAILERVLMPGEATIAVTYADIFGSEKGFGIPKGRDWDWLAKFYKSLRVQYFRPHPWSPVLRVEYSEQLGRDVALGIVERQTQVRSVMEPLPIYMADLLANQCSYAMKLYGEINSRKYPDLYRPTRTVSRK